MSKPQRIEIIEHRLATDTPNPNGTAWHSAYKLDVRWLMDNRWVGHSPAEFHLIHHALRMLAKLPGDDSKLATDLADEMWGLHCSTTHFVRDSGK